MKDRVDKYYIANQIRMRRSSFQGTFIIVEGRSDKLTYSSLVDAQYCEFTIASGKENAIGAIGILEQDKFQGALAVVDADFDRLEGKEILSLNVMLTDEHDLEMMLIKSPALEKLMQELGSEEKIKKN